MVLKQCSTCFLVFFDFLFFKLVRLQDRQTCYTVHKLINNLVTVELAYTYSYVHTPNIAANVRFYEHPRRGDSLVLCTVCQKSRKLF